MRILIVGGGVAGLTLAALLRRRGITPRIVEKAPDLHHAGYMLGLYPIGSRVLHGLGLYDAFREKTVPMSTYRMGNGEGEIVHRYAMDFLDDRYGPILQCTRPELLHLLEHAVGDDAIEFGVSLESVEPGDQEAVAHLSDGSSDAWDLVVAADGIHSTARRDLFGELPYHDTGWGGWVWWAPEGAVAEDTVTELWAAGGFMGLYPSRGKVGVFAGGPLDGAGADEAAGRRARLRAQFAPVEEGWPEVLASLPDDDADLFHWGFRDVRSPDWVQGRVVLLGDAATAFLPTAGIGASMAMESAAVLNDELSRTNARYLPAALDFFVQRRRERVERAQSDSRRLAHMMFVESTPVAAARDFLMRFYSLRMLARDIVRSFDEPI